MIYDRVLVCWMREIACCIREETKRRVRGSLIDKSRHDETRHISRHYDDTSLFWPERSAVAIRGLRKRNSMLVGDQVTDASCRG